MRGCLIDSNIWLAIAFDRHGNHDAAQEMIGKTTPEFPACFCRATEQSVVRLLSTAAIQALYESPGITNEGAIRLLSEWQSEPNVTCIDEPADTRDLWLRLANRNTASPKLWMDAYLAAFAISGKLRLVTNDRAFRQFESENLDLHLL
ncbi:MAG: TA system VapC family ribonuclease toxin [Verrucomicrobiota bacterium]